MRHKQNHNYHILQFINVIAGAYFIVNGVVYRKTGTLTAVTEEGKRHVFYPKEFVSEWWYE